MIAVFGGTFDPPTIAHKQIIQYLANNFGTVIVLPSYTPFYKSAPMASYSSRVEMLSKLDLPENVLISTAEKANHHRTGGKTFSLLSILAETLGIPKSSICPVIGADQAMLMHTWYESDRLLDTFSMHYIDRSATSTPVDPRIKKLSLTPTPVSSTEARAILKADESMVGIIPCEIINLVKEIYCDKMS